jgi:transposase
MVKEMEKGVGCEVVPLNASHLPVIYGSDKKTDKEDSLKLAHLIADRPNSRLPIVPVPSDGDMLKRKQLSSYNYVKGQRTGAVNRLHAKFVHQGITTVVKADLATAERRRETIRLLDGFDREEAEFLDGAVCMYEKRLAELEENMAEIADGDERIEKLEKIPGVGPKVAFAFTAHVDERRFSRAPQVSNYLGLVPKIYISGDLARLGRITKRGNSCVRVLLVQAAWAATNTKYTNYLKERFEYMTKVKGISRKKAIVAIARRMAELMWAVLKKDAGFEIRRFVPPVKRGSDLAQEALRL